MSAITRLDIDKLRNLRSVSIQPSPTANLIIGPNGSGKTSILEAIHILGLGRSFRSNRLDPLVQYEAEALFLYAQFFNGDRVGLRKSRDKNHVLKFNGEKQANWQAVVASMPVQLFNSDSFALLEGGARIRRRFVDWGVFHVEHRFLDAWRNTAKCLSNRNALLKAGRSALPQLRAWDEQFVRHSEAMSRYRSRHFEALLPELDRCVEELLPELQQPVRFGFFRGWREDADLNELLADNLERDLRYGATQRGPHRADITVRVQGQGAADILSRGQQKMLVCAMKLAQIRALIRSDDNSRPILLLDDLAAELDAVNRHRLVAALLALDSQSFFTAIAGSDMPELEDELQVDAKFHVEHGKMV